MSFLSPIWLFGLVPWMAVLIWLLRGRRTRVNVPFINLWRGDVTGPRPKRSWEKPPLALAAALIAILLALLAAAKPVWQTRIEDRTISIIVDRGVTMSARGSTDHRYRELAHQLAPLLSAHFTRVELQTVPHHDVTEFATSELPERVAALPPTALSTADLIPGAAARALRESSGPAVVISDQPLTLDDPRLVQVVPSNAPSNVGIVQFAVRESPAGQAMVRVWNESPLRKVILRLLSDNQERTRLELDLPPTGEHDYFLDVPTLGRVVTAELEATDDLAADNRASLVRDRSWPLLQPRSPLTAEVQRMVETYAHSRPATPSSPRVSIATTTDALATEPAVILAPAPSIAASNQPAQVASHPVTQSVNNWPAVEPAPMPEGSDWTPLVRRGDDVLIAARDQPARQVWVGFHSPEWAATTDFVILWTNIFDWLGQGGEHFASSPIGLLGPEWTSAAPTPEPGLSPGVYRRSDGALRAVNAVDVRIPKTPATDWKSRLQNATNLTTATAGSIPFFPWLLLASLLAICVAALAWPRDRTRRPAGSSLTRFSAARTL